MGTLDTSWLPPWARITGHTGKMAGGRCWLHQVRVGSPFSHKSLQLDLKHHPLD